MSFLWGLTVLGNTHWPGDVQADAVWPPHQRGRAGPGGIPPQVRTTVPPHHIGSECTAWQRYVFVCFFHFRMLVDNVSNKLVQSFGRQEFVVPSNVLGLVYGQTVVWMGALFCPLLPLINVAKFIILFYIKKVTHLVLTSVTHMAEIGCFFFHCWILIQLILNTSITTFFFRPHSLITVGRRRKRFAPPPPLSFSWWSSCAVGAWP